MTTRPSTLGLVLALALLPLALGGCAASLDDYRGTTPELRLERYFLGRTLAHGIVQDRSGKAIKRMQVTLDGAWEGDEFVLREDFRYDDGATEQRVWRLTVLPDGSYRGRAADVVGEARGRAVGHAVEWRYTLRVPVDDTTYDLAFDDRMWLLADGTLVNRAEFSKLGIRFGEVTIFFRKPEPAPAG
jgi:hypothetical protein